MSSRKGGKQHYHRRRHHHDGDKWAENSAADDHQFKPSSSAKDNFDDPTAPAAAAPENPAVQSSPKNRKYRRNSRRSPRHPRPVEESEVGPPSTGEINPEQEQSVLVSEEAVELKRNGKNHEVPEVNDDVEDGVDGVEKRLQELVLSSQEHALSEQQLRVNDQVQGDELLAMESIYGDDMFILDRQNGLRSFQIHIHVETPREVSVSAKLNSSAARETESNSSELLYSFKVEYLPPIILTCVLPHSYPSHRSPYFTISVKWLHPTRVSSLCGMLDSIWNEQSGQEVIYLWAEWLHSSCFSFLGIDQEISLGPYDGLLEGDRRVISGSVSAEADIQSIRSYNDEQRHENFSRNLQECCICFSKFPGTEFVRLPCKHFFCRACMQTFCDMHVKEGTVNKIICPEAKCGGMIPPGLLRVLLGDEEFERWESMMLQKTLESMSDMTYCPRCETICIEDGDDHAQCIKCFFSFCTLCKGGRHVGVECFSPEMRFAVLKERQGSSQINKEQKRREQEFINELLSMDKIKSSAKQCPDCNMAIEKTGGCNKMQCRNCGIYFCYRCNKKIEGYEHFRDGKCGLFDEEELRRWEDRMNVRQVVGRIQAENRVGIAHPCPNCRQINMKNDNNNHIFCWACQTHYCYLCRETVRRAAQHYRISGCKQHTANCPHLLLQWWLTLSHEDSYL